MHCGSLDRFFTGRNEPLRHQKVGGVQALTTSLLEDLQCAADVAISDLAIGDRSLSDLNKLISSVERLPGSLRLKGEELSQTNRNTVKDPLERSNGRVHPVRFDQRNGRIRHSSSLCELALRELVVGAHEAKPLAEIHVHKGGPVIAVQYPTNMEVNHKRIQ